MNDPLTSTPAPDTWETSHTFDLFPDLEWRPRLLLSLRDVDRPPSGFAPGRIWQRLTHQTSGVGCRQITLLGTLLTPRSEREAALLRLFLRMNGMETGALALTLSDVLVYRAALHELLGSVLDCDRSFAGLCEALYPVDATCEALTFLVQDELPEDLDELLVFKDGLERLTGFVNRWQVWILTLNSD